MIGAKSHLSRTGQASQAALEQGLLKRFPRFAAEDPVRFVIVFQARTGSNMVRSALKSHPAVRCYGEVLRSRYRVVERQSPVGLPAKARTVLLQEPTRFVDEHLYGPHPANIKAVGFKLAYGHAREPEWLPIWAHLADQGVRILELRRNDILATLISQELARSSGQFVTKRSSQGGQILPTLHISVEHCERFFEGTATRRQQADSCFADSPRRIFEYSDVIENWAERSVEIQEFLELPIRTLQPVTKKQAGSKEWQSVANIAELRAHFEGTEYATHFAGLPEDLA